MTNPDMDLDISPTPRSREENQERAFIAASRRKDRSLDARIESAQRASMLHKKRTGKALYITKEIVEKEAMYEEVDERYQEKRIRMLQAQNMQIEEEFHRHLLAAFAARSTTTNKNRAGSLTAQTPGTGIRKMSLDLSKIRSPSAEVMQNGPLTSPLFREHADGVDDADGPSPSPATSYLHSPQSCYVSPVGESSLPYGLPAVAAHPHFSSYGTQPATPSWPVQPQYATPFASWQGFSGVPTGEIQPMNSWPHHVIQQHQWQPDAATFQMRPYYRNRLASAPELFVQGTNPSPGSAQVLHSQHARVPSDPTNLCAQDVSLPLPSCPSGPSSPLPDVISTATFSTPEFCTTPTTPYSPAVYGPVALDGAGNVNTKQAEGLMMSRMDADPDFHEFSRFALGLDSNLSLLEQ